MKEGSSRAARSSRHQVAVLTVATAEVTPVKQLPSSNLNFLTNNFILINTLPCGYALFS
jgi:hypothetical protein